MTREPGGPLVDGAGARLPGVGSVRRAHPDPPSCRHPPRHRARTPPGPTCSRRCRPWPARAASPVTTSPSHPARSWWGSSSRSCWASSAGCCSPTAIPRPTPPPTAATSRPTERRHRSRDPSRSRRPTPQDMEDFISDYLATAVSDPRDDLRDADAGVPGARAAGSRATGASGTRSSRPTCGRSRRTRTPSPWPTRWSTRWTARATGRARVERRREPDAGLRGRHLQDRRRGLTHRGERQGRVPAHVVPLGEGPGRSVDREVRVRREQLLEHDPPRQSRGRGAEAVVGAVTEGEDPAWRARDVQLLGVRAELARVAVGGGVQEQDA